MPPHPLLQYLLAGGRARAKKSPAKWRGSSLKSVSRFCFLLRYDVRGLRALLTLLQIELDALALSQGLEAATLNGAEVDEHVLSAIVLGDEAEALGLVEPLHGACSHNDISPNQ